METNKCAHCGGQYHGFGHNGQPVVDGRVCDVCNDLHVVPTRMQLVLEALMKREAHDEHDD